MCDRRRQRIDILRRPPDGDLQIVFVADGRSDILSAMASVNPHTRELVFKIVFYGPGLGGKTTTLQYIHAATKAEHKGKMVSLATPTDRTLYFDFLPVRVPKVNGMSVRLQLFTVPGQVYYEATRKLVLSGTDGVVFVADSQASRLETNQESIEDLETSLAEHGRTLETIPHSFQWNKRDLTDLVSLEDLDLRYNKRKAPSIGTVATRGDGVFEGLERITGLVLSDYNKEDPELVRAGVREAFRALVDAPRVREDEEPAPETVGRASRASPIPRAPVASPRPTEARPSPRPPEVSPRAPEVSPRAPETSPRSPVAALASETRVAQSSGAPAHGLSSSPRPPSGEPRTFSFADLFVETERDGARKVEAFLGVADAHGAVLACDGLLTRVLASAAMAAGAQDAPRDPAVVANLLGCDGRVYLACRASMRSARQRELVTMKDAFECYLFVLDARRRRDDVRRPRT